MFRLDLVLDSKRIVSCRNITLMWPKRYTETTDICILQLSFELSDSSIKKIHSTEKRGNSIVS